MANHSTIDFSKIEGPVYTGRDRGTRLRAKLALDKEDLSPEPVIVIIPDTTYSVSSSFFLGLFGPSVVRFRSEEGFYSKYHFQTNEFIKSVIDGHVHRALQEKNLFSD